MLMLRHSTGSALLLLVQLLSLTWRPTTGAALPVRALCAPEEECSLLFRSLLDSITELLKHKDVLCFGITSVIPAVANVSDTVLACAPTQTQNSGCMMRRESPFNETECLMNIVKDLDHYSATFQSYLKTQLRNRMAEEALLNPTLQQIKSLRKNCFRISAEVQDSLQEEASKWGENSYENRKKMCKIIPGFYSRAITINRAMGYIASGEHRK